MRVSVVLLLALLLAGCAAPQKRGAARPGAENRLGDAVVAPLADLNLIRTPIPPVLATAQKAAYAAPADVSCTGLAAEVESLDTALGADLDVPPADGEPTLLERGADAAGDAVIGAVRSTTEGVLPFRGWLRKLTGAERSARDLSAAVTAGTIRRAYLKGLGQAAGCAAPAAPRPVVSTPPLPPADETVKTSAPAPAADASASVH